MTLMMEHGPNPYPAGTLSGDLWELGRRLRHMGRLILLEATPILDWMVTMSTRLDDYNERRKLEKFRKQARKRWAEAEAVLRTVREKGCARCGASGPSEAHHLVPKSKWSKNEKRMDVHNVKANLIPLCHACHQDHHTTAHKRIPRLVLSEAQIAFVIGKQGESWMDRWYPA